MAQSPGSPRLARTQTHQAKSPILPNRIQLKNSKRHCEIRSTCIAWILATTRRAACLFLPPRRVSRATKSMLSMMVVLVLLGTLLTVPMLLRLCDRILDKFARCLPTTGRFIPHGVANSFPALSYSMTFRARDLLRKPKLIQGSLTSFLLVLI